ncbi:von Willebrand factor A domain-containing protein 5A-like [Mixophyes fleayi]|uniref:von Willebrand factor A domain-containing protein 5A-like n=1 Tax=Mixophyes fleayi TaxID=3061075 RepID=UPI003F4E2B97
MNEAPSELFVKTLLCPSVETTQPLPVESPPLLKLISLQNADGSWNMTQKLYTILGVSGKNLKDKNPDQNMDPAVWATLLAVIWLHASCQEERDEWELLEGKGISWIKSRAGSSLSGFIRAGNELLKSSVDPKVFGL